MIQKFILPSLFLLAMAACGDSSHSFKKAEDAQDAGREFIRASLDGNYEKASFYLYADSTNLLLFNKFKKDYDSFSDSVKQGYHNAEILPINISAVNDSITSYTYANTYKKDTTTIRVIRVNGEWLVDLKEILNRK